MFQNSKKVFMAGTGGGSLERMLVVRGAAAVLCISMEGSELHFKRLLWLLCRMGKDRGSRTRASPGWCQGDGEK